MLETITFASFLGHKLVKRVSAGKTELFTFRHVYQHQLRSSECDLNPCAVLSDFRYICGNMTASLTRIIYECWVGMPLGFWITGYFVLPLSKPP